MKPRLYLETTIAGYMTSWPSRDPIVAAHQQLTKEWWNTRRVSFDISISQFVIDEAAAGDEVAAKERLDFLIGIPLLEITDSVTELADALLHADIIPRKAARDAVHISISAVQRIEYLMTWNCKHIANAEIGKRVRAICEKLGHPFPTICTPEELMEGIP